MGKEKRKRKKEHKQKHSHKNRQISSQPTSNKGILRRTFLTSLGIGSLVGIHYILTSRLPFQKPIDPWSFLKARNHKKNRSVDEIHRDCIRVGESFTSSQQEIDFAYAAIQPHLNRITFEKDIEYTHKTTTSYYIFQASQLKATAYSTYIHKAIAHLEQEVPSLDFSDFTIITTPKNTTHLKNKIFIADGRYNLYRLQFKPNKKNIQTPIITTGSKENGHRAQAQINPSTGEIEMAFAIFNCGPIALSSVFSELLPLATAQATWQYIKKTNNRERAEKLNETLSEAASRLLSESLGKKLGVPNLEQYLIAIDAVYARNELYSDVPKGITLARRIGIAETIKIYNNSIEDYVDATGVTF